MKKRGLLLILPLLLLGLCACGGGKDAAADTAPDAASDEAAAGAPTAVSLRESGLETAALYLNGRAYTGLRLGDSLLAEAGDVTEGFPDLVWQVEGEVLTVSDAAGHSLELPCVQCVPGQMPEIGTRAVAVADSSGSIVERWVDVQALAGVSLSDPTDSTLGDLFLRCLYDEAYQTWYLSRALDTALIPAGAKVPVLMYHAVADETWGLEGLFMRPADMREELQFLTENGYDLIFFSDLAHLADYDKPVILTFDDGYTDNYTNLFPLLQEFQAKATIFVITNNVDYNDNFMDRPEVKELADSGLVDIGSHTVSHGDLATMSAAAQEAELRDSQLAIARVTGRVPYVLSYPAGGYNADTLEVAPRYYDVAVKSRGDLWTVGGSFFEIDRFPVYRGVSLSTVQGMVEQ